MRALGQISLVSVNVRKSSNAISQNALPPSNLDPAYATDYLSSKSFMLLPCQLAYRISYKYLNGQG